MRLSIELAMKLKCFTGLWLLLALPSFAQERAPKCQVDPKSVSQLKGNAGCLIKIQDKMLMVRDLKSQKLSPPGGKPETDQTAQCTAHHETWEETGLNVKVGRLLANFNQHFLLFACKPVNAAKLQAVNRLKVPSRVAHAIQELLLLNPSLLKPEDWRFPKQLPVIQKAFSGL